MDIMDEHGGGPHADVREALLPRGGVDIPAHELHEALRARHDVLILPERDHAFIGPIFRQDVRELDLGIWSMLRLSVMEKLAFD